MIAFEGLAEARRADTSGFKRTAEHFLHVLGHDALPRPEFVLRDNLDVRWLGRCLHIHDAPNTVIELQRAVLTDPDTLARVIAHEVIHHVQFLIDPPTTTQIKFGLWDGHGQDFERFAKLINEHEGVSEYVTKRSDQSYVLAMSDREIYLLVKEVTGGRVGWQWAARLTPKMQFVINGLKDKMIKGGPAVRLVKIKADRHWTTGSVRIGSPRGWSLPDDAEHEATLRRYLRGGA